MGSSAFLYAGVPLGLAMITYGTRSPRFGAEPGSRLRILQTHTDKRPEERWKTSWTGSEGMTRQVEVLTYHFLMHYFKLLTPLTSQPAPHELVLGLNCIPCCCLYESAPWRWQAARCQYDCRAGQRWSAWHRQVLPEELFNQKKSRTTKQSQPFCTRQSQATC